MENKISEIRQSMGLTQEQLAERLGISRQTLNYIENGRRLPIVDLALRMAKELNTTVEQLFYGNQ